MGRSNKCYYKDLHQQAYDVLTKMLSFGESKKEAARCGTNKDKIYSYNTFKTYWKHIKYFIQYINENHPECTTLRSARKYVHEWLQVRSGEVDSAWTIQTEAKAIGKMYGIKPDDEDYFIPPKRERENIKRSRGDCVSDKHFSKKNNDELIKFCQGTGLRRRELVALKGGALITSEQICSKISFYESKQESELTPYDMKQLEILKDTRLFNEDYYIYVRNGKGGRERISPIVGKFTEQIVDRMEETPADEKAWKHVSGNADIHGYRSDYATNIYKEYARDINDIPYNEVNKGTGNKYQSDVYTCRKDESGRKLDKKAMLKCSKALGHNRICVVANNYLSGI